MFGGKKRNDKRNDARRRDSEVPSYDEHEFDGDDFGRNQPPPHYDDASYDPPPQQRREAYSPSSRPNGPQRDQGYQNGNSNRPQQMPVESEPTMLPESRRDRQQRAANRMDGTSRDRAIRELPPTMPELDPPAAPPRAPRGNGRSAPTPPPPAARNGRSNGRDSGYDDRNNGRDSGYDDRSNGRGRPSPPPSTNNYDEIVGAPPARQEPQYDNVIGAPPAPSQPARRPERPQGSIHRPQQRPDSVFDDSRNGNNGRSSSRPQQPQARQPQAPRPQRPNASAQLTQPVRFDDGSQAAGQTGGRSDNGYANYETVKKGRKKGRRRKKKEQVQLPDQKMDVGEAIELRDGTSRLLMRFDAGIVDNLRHMTTRLSATTGEIPSRIALVSALPGEGVTYVARALATVMAHDMSARVAYVDLNWWSDGAPAFAHPDNQGLVSVVTGDKRLDEIFVSTMIPNLTLVPGGQLERGDRPIMARSNVLHSAIEVLDQHFDYLIFDVPAIRATNDAVPLAKLAKGVVMVVKQGETPNETVRQAIDEIQHLNLLGMMLNQVKYKTPEFIRRIIPQD